MSPLDGFDDIDAYLAEPAREGETKGGLVLIHEAWGLVDHITDVADRLAAEGYVVVAPDLLSRVGIRPALADELQTALFSPDEAVRTAAQPGLREAMGPMRSPEFGAHTIAALRAAVDLLAARPDVAGPDGRGRLGVLGFCFGGTYSFALAAADDRIRAAVPFYGQPPEGTDASSMRCPVLAFYGETDDRLTTPLPEVTSALRGAGVDFEPVVYPAVGHAFFNDTNAMTYDRATAEDAWTRSLAFLEQNLR